MTIPSRIAASAGRTLESRLAEVEDRLAIQDLTARYNFAIDNRDLQSVGDLFTDNGSFGSKDGAMRAVGRAAVLKQFEGRFSVLGATNHFAHDHSIWFESPTRARGLLSVHAEVWRNGRATFQLHAPSRQRFQERQADQADFREGAVYRLHLFGG